MLDLAIARNIRLGGGRSIQLRLDMFNAPNSAIITGRNTTMNVPSPNDPTNDHQPAVQSDANGSLIPNRVRCRISAGFGVATGYQAPRTVQFQVRFAF